MIKHCAETNGELLRSWKREEEIARIQGWDFSHINDRYEEEDSLPWDYRAEILARLSPPMKLLDIDTGGGEFLLSLAHPYENTFVTENYPPNAEYCARRLAPLGIGVYQAPCDRLPFADGSFDRVIDRHGDLNAREIGRVLKKGGLFITQQVGAQNDRELVEMLIGKDAPVPFPEQTLEIAQRSFQQAGFEIVRGEEHFGAIRFYDAGALVWFAKIIAWEFPGFSVERNLEQLKTAHERIRREGCVSGRFHRFLLIAKKL